MAMMDVSADLGALIHSHALFFDRRRWKTLQKTLTEDAAGGFHSSALVNVGDTIQVDHEAGFLRGHGTQVLNGELLATVCGVVERVNKLVSVRPLRARYNAETGDVVVGRVTEVGVIYKRCAAFPDSDDKVATKRWKVEVNSKKDAELMLSAVNLPGGIQRRRTAADELNMRDLYVENDLISAEVQTLHQDGSLHLHTRSLKYGKLRNGQLVKVPPYLVKRLKQHFHQLKEFGVDLILGCNGYIWVSATVAAVKDESFQTPAALAAAPLTGAADVEIAISHEVREKICRLANCIRVLGALGLLISPDSILQTYEASVDLGVAAKDILSSEFHVKVFENETEKRSTR